jgi:hypothetical protein
MSHDVIEDYEAIRQTIKRNVQAIRALLAQADELSAIVVDMTDPEVKKSLTASVESLYKRIDELIEETDKLFNQFVKFAKSVSVARV